MDRRLVGAIVLGVVAMAAVVVPAAARLGTPGRPAAPAFGAVAAGDCTVTTAVSRVLVVPCGQPHTGEIETVLPPTTSSPSPDSSGSAGGSGADAAGQGALTRPRTSGYACFAAIPEFLGASAALTGQAGDTGWLVPNVDYSVGTAMTVSGAGEPSGAGVCVISPILPPGQRRTSPTGQTGSAKPGSAAAADSATYTGRVSALSVGTGPAATLHECFSYAGPTDLTGCTTAHAGEVVAVRTLAVDPAAVDGLPTDPDSLQQCRQSAAAAIGTGDPTFGGRAALTLQADRVGTDTNDGRTLVRLSCDLTVGAPATLTGSVLGLGDAALPLDS